MTLKQENREGPAVLVNWIDGEACPPHSGEYIDDMNPATNERNAWIPRSQEEDIREAVRAANQALQEGSWSRLNVVERAAYLDAIADEIERRSLELARLESQDTGKPVSLASRVDIPRAVANFRFFAGAVRHAGTESYQMSDAINYAHRKPVGVVGLITPWNLPLYLLSWKVAPALAMGNSIVAKPSEVTPLTASVLAEIIHQVGIPPGVFNLVHGLGTEAGQALVEHPDVKAISFTGGTATGAKVAATAAPQFKKLSLELGGKNPSIVFADCDFDAAVEGTVRAGFANQGQVCLCGSRLLVERSIYDKFLDAYVQKVESLKVGAPDDPTVNMGSLSSLAHRDKVESYIALAREEGGRVLCGGKRPSLPAPWSEGAFLEPTVIAGLTPHCRTVQEEIFGPVVTVIPFDTDEEALVLANGVRYGLAASVWTRDVVRAHRFSEALETGMVWVNTWLHRDLRVPFGGVKDSGVGREGGERSLGFFSEVSNICIHLGPSLHTAAPVAVSSGDTRLPMVDKREDTDPHQRAVPASIGEMLADGQTISYEEVSEQASSEAIQQSSMTVAYTKAVSPEQLAALGMAPQAAPTRDDVVHIASAPKPVGAYPHARKMGDLLFLSGIGPRHPVTDEIPGGPIKNADGKPLSYDVAAQTQAVIENVKLILEKSGSSFENIIDVQVFLIDMDRDFKAFNAVYAEHFSSIQATRTTIAINALPTPIAVEFKVIAKAGE